jgi:protocatechuate 3,4-dioxygenase beta subunit
MRNLPSLRALCTLMLAVLAAASTTASKAQLVSALPDADPRSGRFINITSGLSSIGENGASIGLIAPSAETNLRFGIFDGDLGGKWDPYIVPDAEAVRFALYADPLANGGTDPANLVGQWYSGAMPDDAWFDLILPNSAAALDIGRQQYRYNLRVTWKSTVTGNVQNNFKVRTFGAACATGRSSFGFIGYAPNDSDQVKFPKTTFNGHWSFYLDVSAAPTSIGLWNGDFDRTNDTDDSNSPPAPPFAYIAVSDFGERAKTGAPADADIDQSLTAPDGSWTVSDGNPSGDKEWENLAIRVDGSVAAATYANPTSVADADWKVPSMPAGLYRWQITGADGRNTLFLHPDYDLYGMSQLGDFVWDDLNANGIQDAGEAGVANVTVQLLDATFAAIATTTTDAAGAYGFDNLVPGTYSVRFALPAGYVFTVAGAGTNPEANSHAGTGGLTEQVILGPGQSAFFLDAGLVRPASVGDFVWEDMNYNGVQDAGEPGVGGVTVNLLTSGGAVSATTTTTSAGAYSFTNLAPGAYAVQFELPAGYQFTQRSVDPNATTQSHADATTGITETHQVLAGGAITILDGGLIRVASLGDRVWLDANRNGLQDAGEAGVAGVTVRLLDAGGVEVAAPAITNAAGGYLFSDLAPGTYSVVFTTPAAYTFTTQGVGVDPEADSNAGPTGATGPVTLSSGDNVTSVDAGLIGPASLGDRVWNDADSDGIQDVGEVGVAGVTVKLLSSADAVLATKTTGTTGNYLFDNLAPGTYKVQFTLPTGYTFTLKGIGSNRDVDSDADTTTGITSPVTLASGDNVTSVDAGLKRSSCSPPYTTYTQGGWGAKPSGNNPGALLAAKFCRVYGSSGVTIGGGKTLRFTSAYAIEVFLPQGGTAKALTASAVNPTAQLGVLAGQVLAMRLSIDFSAAGITRSGLGSLRIQSGAFAGLTVTQFSAIANAVLGGGSLPSGKTIADINATATAINENFDNGTTNNGFLK